MADAQRDAWLYNQQQQAARNGGWPNGTSTERSRSGSARTVKGQQQHGKATAQRSADQHSSGHEVPVEFYDLAPEEQKRFLASLQERETKTADDNLALQSVRQVLDLRDKDRAEAKRREAELVEVIAGLTARLDALEAADRSHKVEASEELAKQQTQMADAVLNAAAVEASLRNQTAASQAAHDQQGAEVQTRLQAMEQPITQLEGRVRSTIQLMQERGNAVEKQVADVEGRQVRLGVTLTELEGQADAIGQPITRAEMAGMVDQKVAAEFSSKLTNERVAEVVRRNFIPAAPSTSIDALNLPDPQFAPVPGAGGN